MLPYKTILAIDKKSRTPIYLQIAKEFIKNISSGLIRPGTKLPGSRQLSELLSINRRTAIAAYDELSAQGWININPNKGCFVNEELPQQKAKPLAIPKSGTFRAASSTSESINPLPVNTNYEFVINDGYPDVRLAPLKEFAKNYSYILNSPMSSQLMTYRQKFKGDEVLRRELINYLAETRSIHVDMDHIMTTRGSLMAFYILFKSLITPDHNQVIAAYPGFNEGHKAIQLAGGVLNYVDVDAKGMDINQVESLCKKKKIRAVFVIPHHHYPTTVSLNAQRRMELLKLAEKYHFVIVEDDYDYDFHYASAPILPVASIDRMGSVAYVGSFSKTVAPALRLGFIVASKPLIQSATEISKYIDSFGNIALERSVALLFQDGHLRRHVRKALKTYRERRDHFCHLLRTELGDHVDFTTPEGGLAIWLQLKKVGLKELRHLSQKRRIYIPDASGYYSSPFERDVLRIGFASMTTAESEKLIWAIKEAIQT